MDKSYLKNITQRLKSVNRKKNLKAATKGFYILLSIFASLILFFSLLEMWGYFSTDNRSIFFVVTIIVQIGLFILLILKPLLQSTTIADNFDIFNTAKLVGASFPKIKDELLNALQLIKNDTKNLNYSEELIEEAFKEVYEKADGLDFKLSIHFRSLKKYLLTATSILLITAALVVFITPMNNALSRIIDYDKEFEKPLRFTFQIYPGDVTITKGDSLNISVKIKGDSPSEVYLFSKSAAQSEFVTRKLNIDSTGNYNTKFFNLKNSIEYYIAAEEISSRSHKIEVINPPIVNSFELTITSPYYSRVPEVVQKDNGNITSLLGSRVGFKINSSKGIKNAELIFENRETIALAVNDKIATGNLRLSKDDNYRIRITDQIGNENINPINYSISVVKDQFPIINVISPENDITVTGSEKLPVVIKLSDDYGFSKLLLYHRLSESNFENPVENYSEISIPIRKNVIDDEIYFVWDLSELLLAVEDVTTYYFEIFDNDNISGPKSTKTGLFKLRVPSVDEIFAQADETQEKSESELVEALEEAEKLSEELAKISDELKRDEKEITWEEKEAIENSMEKFENLQEKIENIQSELAKMQEELQENNLLSEETMQKYMELQELLDELSSEEMKEAMAKMQERLQKMNRKDAQQSLENMEMNEEAFKKSIERTVNLLKKIQIEQKMDEISKRIEKINESLEELEKETEESDLSDKNESENLQQKQEQVKQDSKKLEEQMENLQEKMSEFNEMPNDKMQEMMEKMADQQNQQLAENSKQLMKQNQKNEAIKSQQQMSKNMKQNLNDMQQMMEQMMQQNQMQVMSEMMQLTNEMIKLSKQQEKLKEEVKKLPPNSDQLSNKAREQNEIKNNLNSLMQKMVKLSQETFAVTPEMGKELGNASRMMSESLSAMAERQNHFSGSKQQGAMEHLNAAASLMKGSMQAMMNSQGQGSGGMMSMMQQMQQMSQQQMGLNQMTQMLSQGALTPEQQGQLQRMAQQQQLIQKSMQQLNKEAKESGQSKKLASNLEKILEDIKEVITGMETEKIDDDLIQKQEKILSKMLDAQRSINERDYEKKRESNSGQNITRESPPELILSTEEGKNKLRDELMKASKEGYSKDYQELIRKYFEAVEKSTGTTEPGDSK